MEYKVITAVGKMRSWHITRMLSHGIPLVISLVILVACGDKKPQTKDDQNEDMLQEVGKLEVDGGANNPVNESLDAGSAISLNHIDLTVDFGTLAVSLQHQLLKSLGSAPLLACAGEISDSPSRSPGDDCDSNGGVVAFQTPSKYKLAFKSLSVIYDDTSTTPIESNVHKIIDFESLDKITDQGIFEFSPNVSTMALNLPEERRLDRFLALSFELYFYELSLVMYGAEHTIRIYMSDDDFSTQGGGGHHQGDITYFDSEGVEHWAQGGENWFENPNLTIVRGNFANGAGGDDPETGHVRGMFGDAEFWNATQRMQGVDQDFYTDKIDLDVASDSNGRKYTLYFDIADTWYYEDFNLSAPNSFDPCKSASLEGCGASWAPILPKISLLASAVQKEEQSIDVLSESSVDIVLGEEASIVVSAKSNVEIKIKEHSLPNGSTLGEQVDKTDKVGAVVSFEASRTLSWTPTEDDFQQSPFAFSYIVSDDFGISVLHAIRIDIKKP